MTLKGFSPVLEPLTFTRVVSTPGALNEIVFDRGNADHEPIVFRTAPDEAMVLNADAGSVIVTDEHAIIAEDSGWCGAWLPLKEAEQFLRNNASWHLPAQRPVFAQGMVASAPVKVWAEKDRILFVVPHVYAQDLQMRITS